DLGQIIRRVMGAPEFSETFTGLDKTREYDLVVVNYDNLSEEEQNELIERFSPQAGGNTRLLLISEHHAHEDYVRLFGTRTLTNLLAVNNKEVDVDDLIVTLQKLLRRDVFGLEKYFVWGASSFSTKL